MIGLHYLFIYEFVTYFVHTGIISVFCTITGNVLTLIVWTKFILAISFIVWYGDTIFSYVRTYVGIIIYRAQQPIQKKIRFCVSSSIRSYRLFILLRDYQYLLFLMIFLLIIISSAINSYFTYRNYDNTYTDMNVYICITQQFYQILKFCDRIIV